MVTPQALQYNTLIGVQDSMVHSNTLIAVQDTMVYGNTPGITL